MAGGLRFVLALLGLLATGQASALDFPLLSGRVVDDAGTLAASKAALEQKLAALESKTTDQLVVATVRSLQGTSIEDFANQLFRRWQLGQKDKNNGVLLLVAPTERKVRIEVGRGLEGTLTDAVTRLIIENSILPRFRTSDFPGGINRGVDDIIQVLSGDAEEWKRRATPSRRAQSPGWIVALPFLMVLSMFIIFVLVAVRHPAARPANRALRARQENSWWTSDTGSSSSSSSWSSSDSGGFSGGGGDSGGGGASGSW